MLNVYCIPGMGVNERLFRNLKLNNCNIIHVKWLTPFKNESLSDYAMRLSKQIDASKPFALIGVSFGGMCCVEISKQLKPLKTFIISSSKFKEELPLKISFWRKIPIYRFFRDGFYKNAVMLAKKQFGVITEEQKTNFRKMLDEAPQNYFNGAVDCIVKWENKTRPHNLIHIHGNRDRVLPHRKVVGCDYTIEGGTHFMIINKAEEINKIINAELEKVID
ncbi:MAG: alpha/beta hydrolase [Bacteroidia bacterium]